MTTNHSDRRAATNVGLTAYPLARLQGAVGADWPRVAQLVEMLVEFAKAEGAAEYAARDVRPVRIVLEEPRANV